ncbi:two-component sensor histidine kinase [Ktedonobacter sp. SOSP1-52]|uniref:sensor histidine kinase n=1 Tax=Ktedonobacter sp. SOSP1-52 TaxID=2778366 RepID=UPI0019160D66|nr:ATP-binding protein [Ktedonobacter sp. SOSP1-52]GHO62241.1 two-component sensor histidine kinase [Ktedonobacter sp. SOSP1-52]
MKTLQRLRSHLWPMGTRLQLTFWYTAVLALIILCAGAIVYKYLESSLEGSFDTTLSLQVGLLTSEISEQNNHLTISDRTGNIPSLEATHSDPRSIPADITNGLLVRILDSNGRVVRESPGFRLYALPTLTPTQFGTQQIMQQTLKLREQKGDKVELRLYSQVLTDHGRPYAIIQVGESLNQLHSVLRNTAYVLLLLTPFLLAISGLGSYWLAARAFAPIHQLTSTARAINSGDLSQRVPLPRARDEVYFLGATLNAMIARLEGAFTRQKRFVADASHELRTPIAAIQSKTDVALLQPLSTQEYVEVIQQVNTEALRLGDLIRNLLALARSDEEEAHLIYESVHLDQVVDAVISTATELAQERDIILQAQDLAPVEVQGDEARLIQVVMNLVDNAITYTSPHGCVSVTVKQEGTQGLLVVRDTGRGIAPEHLPHIFERFYRADAARSRDAAHKRGSGLGLAIVDWIIRAHQGRISVESTVGKGSTFTVSLPLKQMIKSNSARE